MNFNQIIEKIRSNRTLQIIVGLAFLVIFIIIVSSLFSTKSSKRSQGPSCYNITLKIWAPFDREKFLSLINELSRYCIDFSFEKKSLEEIMNDLPYSLAGDDFPDLVYLNNDYLNKYKEFFATPTPVNVDALVFYYNKDILNFFQIQPPKVFDELKSFIQKIKEIGRKDFFPIGLGTKDIRNRKEIILTFMTLAENYNDRDKFRANFTNALELYHSFSDSGSEFYAYDPTSGNDLDNFAQEKLAIFVGFYKDKKEILEKNPRLNYGLAFFANTFPPKMKVYTEIFYLAPIKNSKNLKISNDLLNWFAKYKLKDFAEIFDLVPVKEDLIVDEDKKIVFASAKNFGETFDFLKKEVIFENVDRILDRWENKEEVETIIEDIANSL